MVKALLILSLAAVAAAAPVPWSDADRAEVDRLFQHVATHSFGSGELAEARALLRRLAPKAAARAEHLISNMSEQDKERFRAKDGPRMSDIIKSDYDACSECVSESEKFIVSDQRLEEIGVGLACFGISFLFLGVLLLFDKGLLAIGNILFISGLACVIGLQRTFFFFFQRHKAKATLAFFGGIVVVLLGWPMVGMIAETYGFLLLFRGFLPAAVNFVRMIPVLGSLLNLPIIRGVVDRIAGDTGRNMV